MITAWWFLLPAVVVTVYAYVGYPTVLFLVALARRASSEIKPLPELPHVSITVPAFNEEHTISGTLDALLSLDYPRDKTQILVVSDASTDQTDQIVRDYASRGVELLRLPERAGKTAAEDAASARLTGDIVVNTDASIRIPRGSLRPLITAFGDPNVGVASGRDISTAQSDDSKTHGEGKYVGYEMWVRDLETQLGGIIGASGCFYAIRAHLHKSPLPAGLSRDFAAALIAKENGYKAVSVPEAVCYVPRTDSLRREYRRKVRTMTRGIGTLLYKKHLLNPFKHGAFAWKLLSHKVCRWAVPWLMLPALLAVITLSIALPWARWLLGLVALFTALGALGWIWQDERRVPRFISLPAFALTGNIAALRAAINIMTRYSDAIWEPTKREMVDSP